MAHEHRDRQRSSIPFPFNKLPVARSLGGSSHCFIHNEKERLLDTIWEGDNGISSKAGKEEEEISGLWRRRICRSFHAFSRRPFGAMIIRAPLAVNVAKKGIIACRAAPAKISDKTSIFSLSSADPAAIDDSAENLEMSTVAVGRSPSLVGSNQRQKSVGDEETQRGSTNPKSLSHARRLADCNGGEGEV